MNLDTVYTGDNVTTLAIFPDACIDLTVTSPPYDDMDLDYNPLPKNGLRTYNGYTWDFKGLAAQLYRVTKPGGVVVWVVNDPTINGSESLASSLQKIYFRRVGFNVHDTMIWNKGGFTATGDLQYRYAPVFEYMLILSKGLPRTFNPIKDRVTVHGSKVSHGTVRNPNGSMKGKSNNNRINELSQRYSIWDMPAWKSGGIDHPAVFPEALARDHILSWSNPGDVVLDPFAGSGTTLKMAKQLDRRFVGIELSFEYVEKIIKPRLAGANVPLAGFAEMLK